MNASRRAGSLAAAFAAVAVVLTQSTSAGQDAGRASTFIAFRVDGTHAIGRVQHGVLVSAFAS